MTKTKNLLKMKNYQIIEENEKRGIINGETFETLQEAISRLETFKWSSRRHGRILKEAVKSFTWEWLDQYNTSFLSTYKIEKIS
jgi:hypothetical protein